MAETGNLMSPHVQPFLDEATNTISYVVRDPQGRSAAIIDSVLDFDLASDRTDTRSADAIVAHVRAASIETVWILETHVHADHLSAAPHLQERLRGRIGIGQNIRVVQDTFGKAVNEGAEFRRDGSRFDRLFRDGHRATSS
jgi:glyoxylase-like metal-dependent hydrolase (beta-lactamase superfamily II)